MKVAIVTQPRDGIGKNTSLGIITLGLAIPLSRQNEVIIYGKRNPGIKESNYENTELKYKYIPVSIDDYFIKPFLKILRRLGIIKDKKLPGFASQFYYLFYAVLIGLHSRIHKCDIVHIHNYSQFVPVIKMLNPSSKIVLHMNCEWLTQIEKRIIERRLIKADLILSCSNFITNRNKKQFPALADRFFTLYNGVDPAEFVGKDGVSAQNNIKKILFVGRISPEKGVHVLLDAFNSIAKKYPDTELEIVGPWGASSFIVELDKDKIVQDMAKFYNTQNYSSYVQTRIDPEFAHRVKFPGAISHSELKEYYHKADIFVFPSAWNEPFGIPVVEAMASGIPVITTNSGGIIEIAEEGKSGLIVERNSQKDLAKAIELLLTNEKLRNKIAIGGKKRAVKNFTWDQLAERLIKLYEIELKKTNLPALRKSVSFS